MKNKYFYPIYKLKIKSWIKYWLIKQTEFKGVLSDILEGISFYLTDSLNMKFKMFKIYGRTIQDGNPTPKNPVPIKNTGDNGSVNEKVQNRNLIDVSYTKENPLNINGSFTTINLDLQADKVKNIIKAGDTIRLSCKAISNGGTITRSQLYLGNGTNTSYLPASMITITNQESTISNYGTMQNDIVETGNHQLMVVMYASSGENYKVYDFMLEKVESNGEVTYVPHSEQNISFPLAQGQKLYQDEELKENGKDDIWSEYIFTGEENWTLYSETENELKAYSTGIKLGRTNNMESTKDAFCTHFKNNTFYSSTNGIGLTQNATYVSVSKTIASNVSELKSWFATQYTNETPVKVQYKKKNPTTTPYTEGQQQYYDEHIKPLRTYKNVTHISSEDETPALLKIQYWKEG